MLGNKSNDFKDKFKLLNSQPLSQDITWSSSDSSDYENSTVPCHSSSGKKVYLKKRKRKNNTSKNISNLDITILDSKITASSPYIACKSVNKSLSPILQSPYFRPIEKTIPASPTLSSKQKKAVNSPILAVKSKTAKSESQSKRKLFGSNEVITKIERSPSPVIVCSQLKLTNREHLANNYVINKSISLPAQHIKKKLRTNNTNYEFEDIEDRGSKSDILNKVQSYFDSHFSSQSLSQHSIIETQTQKCSSSSNNVEIDFTVSLTQVPSSNRVSFESIKSKLKEPTDTDNSFERKKAKYKKDGLAYKLNAALKKQNGNVSLWQHERYLADNSNFVIPKENCMLFHLKNVINEFGCFLLEVTNIDDETYFIVLNSFNVKHCNLVKDTVLRLFEPYVVFEVDSNKIIVNVCKYDCLSVKTDDSILN